jgi:hypothetical protein
MEGTERMMHERISRNGAPVVGFGAPIQTNVPTVWIAVPVFGLVLGAVGAGVGYLVAKKHGAVVGGVTGGVVGGALGWWGTNL